VDTLLWTLCGLIALLAIAGGVAGVLWWLARRD
jgi:hypothetical protein